MGPDSRHLSAWSAVSAKRLEIPKEAFDATQTQPDIPAALCHLVPKTTHALQSAEA